MRSRRVRLLLIGLFAALFLFSLSMVLKTTYEYHEIEEADEDLQQEFVTEQTTVVPPTGTTTAVQTGPTGQSDPTGQSGHSGGNHSTVYQGLNISVDFDKLLRQNADVVGWLYAPGTVINYPVLRSADNDYYLYRNLKKQHYIAGSLFADYRCTSLESGKAFLIFGHSMKNGSMFGTLLRYKNQSYYNQHPVMYFLTPEQNYKMEVVAGLNTEPDDAIYQLSNPSESFADTIARFTAHSTFRSAVTLSPDDCVIALSTCAYGVTGSRFVVLGRLTPME